MAAISTKIGLHIEGGTSVPLVSPMGVKPRVVKLVNCSPTYARDVLAQVGPECLVVIRTTQFDGDWMKDPRGSAWKWLDWYAHDWRVLEIEFPNLRFEGVNEPADEDADAYVQWETIRLDGSDCNAVVGNWSVGRPSEVVFPKYAPIFNMMGPNDLVGFHGYAGAYKHISNPWHTCRFSLPEFAPYLEGKQIVMTEIGADFVKDDNLPESEWGASGWKAAGLTEDEYIGWLRRFGEVYAAFPQVAGACVFGVGGFGWQDFDVTGLWPHVVAGYAEPAPVEPSGRWVQKTQMEDEFDGERWRFTVERWTE